MQNILIVVPQVPQFDQNAGDWRIYSICRILKRTYGVYVLPIGYRWQGEQYVRQLRKEGIRVLFPGYKGELSFGKLLETYDFSTVIFEHYYVAAEFKSFLCRIPRVIIDTHQIDFMQRIGFLGLNSRFEEYAEVQELMRQGRIGEIDTYRMADELIAISEKDQRILRRHLPQKKISVVPTCVDIPTRVRRAFADREGAVFFASFTDNPVNPNADAVRFYAHDILPHIRESSPDVGFTAAGSNADLLTIPGIDRCSDVGAIDQMLGTFRVFVCPLRFGGGTKKKILDAASAGIPIVTTSVGVDGLDFTHGKDIFVADSPRVFARHVVALYQDRRLWEKISRNALSTAKRLYSMRVMERSLQRTLGGKYARG